MASEFFRRWLRVAALLTMAVPVMAQSPAQLQPPAPVVLTVLAEPQLSLPLTELTRLYSLEKDITILAAYEDSRTQFDQLMEGESADVIITSLPVIITELRQRGMVDVYAQTSIAGDKLVLAARKSEALGKKRDVIRALAGQPVLLANPDRYVEGLYGEMTLPYLHYNRAVTVESRRYNSRNAMYNAIRTGSGIGIVLQSEAMHMGLGILSIPIEESSHPPIRYQGMAMAGEHMQQARDFLEYLKTDAAQEIFARYSFSQR